MPQNQILLPLVATQITTGAPNTGVTAFRGNCPNDGKPVQMILQHNATTAPQSIVEGIRRRWSEVFNNSLATCGIANPMNATGPQYAVTIAVKIPVVSNRKSRLFLTSTPTDAA